MISKENYYYMYLKSHYDDWNINDVFIDPPIRHKSGGIFLHTGKYWYNYKTSSGFIKAPLVIEFPNNNLCQCIWVVRIKFILILFEYLKI